MINTQIFIQNHIGKCVICCHPYVVSATGNVLDREKFTHMLKEYYQLRGWDPVTGLPDPLMQAGYAPVPDKPGLGIDLNDEGIQANLRRPGLFESTEEWDMPKLGPWRPDDRWSA